MGGIKKTPNQFLTYVGGDPHSLLMAELNANSLPNEIAKAKALLIERKRDQRDCKHYDHNKVSQAKRKIKQLEEKLQQVKDFLISQGYHPLTLTKVTA